MTGGGALRIGMAMAVSGLAAAATAAEEPVERGRHLVQLLDCGTCHSPKVGFGPEGPIEDEARRLSGHPADEKLAAPSAPDGGWVVRSNAGLTAWAGPWGISYATNLTPDENTGIGSWSQETFAKAMRTGRHMGAARPILPPMPWFAYRHLSDEDLAALFAYLRSIPAVKNRVPDPTINPPPAP